MNWIGVYFASLAGALLAILPIVNPFGAVPLVMSASGHLPEQERLRQIRRACTHRLDRDLSPEHRVPCSIDITHSPGGQKRGDFVGAESCSWLELRGRRVPRDESRCGRFDEIRRGLLAREQRLDLAPE